MKRIPQKQILEVLERLEGTYGLYIENLDTGEIFESQADRVLPSASIIKIPMLALLLKDAEEGMFDLDAPQTIDEVNRVGGTGILYELDKDYRPSLYTMGKLMIVLSDNMCTNHIMDLIGMERFNSFWEEQGYSSFRLMRKTMDWEQIAKGKNNYLNAGDTGRLLSEIAKGTLFSEQICKTMIQIMGRQYYNDLLPALIPAVPSYAPPEAYERVEEGYVSVAHKTGGLNRVQHDAGIFTLPDGRRYIIAMLTADLVNDLAGAEAIRQISRLVYKALG